MFSVYADSCMGDIDEQCVGGCVAKQVDDQFGPLRLFHTKSEADKDIPIYQVVFILYDQSLYMPEQIQHDEGQSVRLID